MKESKKVAQNQYKMLFHDTSDLALRNVRLKMWPKVDKYEFSKLTDAGFHLVWTLWSSPGMIVF